MVGPEGDAPVRALCALAHALFFEGRGVALASFLAMGAFTVPALLRLRQQKRSR